VVDWDWPIAVGRRGAKLVKIDLIRHREKRHRGGLSSRQDKLSIQTFIPSIALPRSRERGE